MEGAISLLSFKGSITEAVVEAKRQKRLFVVYISGQDPESTNLEESTWTDHRVAESISKYCILLHILDGSTDAAHFSAIYPQKSVPCIAAIGYNGVQVWGSVGFVSAEDLASSLEKAWLSLHIQDTTATFLTAAAVASRKAEQPSPDASPIEQGSSSKSDEQSSPSKNNLAQSSETTKLANLEMDADTKCSDNSVESITPKPADVASSSSVTTSHLETGVSIPSTAVVKESLNKSAMSDRDISAAPRHARVNNIKASGIISHKEASKPVVDTKADTLEAAEKTEDTLETSRSKSTDVHLNIRLPNGSSLQQKFSVTSLLKTVKDYVDENQESSVGSYDLAIPYPRKVFDNQDLSKTLSELDLFNRQALIVIPHHRVSYSGHDKAASSSLTRAIPSNNNDIDSSNRNNEGYFAYVKRLISYVNPFTYLGGGGANSAPGPAQESRSNMWHSPNPAVQNNLNRGGGRRPQNDGGGVSGNSSNSGITRRVVADAGRFGSGSNIHTLKRDEDEDDRFTGKNAFWNGNSTQYGGDNNDAK